jgi:hypothetical protein
MTLDSTIGWIGFEALQKTPLKRCGVPLGNPLGCGLQSTRRVAEDPLTQPSRDDTSPRDARETELLTRELERRLTWISRADDDEFGRFTRLDWWICTVFFLVLPVVAVWWAA